MSTFAGLPSGGAVAGDAVVLCPPEVRRASEGLRPWHPTLGFDVLAGVVDGGEPSQSLRPWLDAGAVPVVVGAGRLLEQAARPVAALVLDAHTDLLRADVTDPERTVLAGVRGPQDAPDELDVLRDRGVELLTSDELRALGPGEFSERVLARTGGGPCLLSLDLDVIDPAFAPAVATPEVAGLLPHEVITLLRSLAGTTFLGFELRGLDPSRDGAAQTTAVLAANLVWEMLALRVLSGP